MGTEIPPRLRVMRTIKLPRGTWRYDPDRQLGEAGGFGTVFAGLGEGDEEVAIKRLHLTAAEAAHRELRIADELVGRDFSHVIPIFDAGQDAESDGYYVVMAQAESSLQDYIDAGSVESAAQGAAIMGGIAQGLNEAADIVHRDLKPGNVLLHDGNWKIADFGIARFVEESTSINTLKKALSPRYAAPEQWRGDRATTATDVYALGCIGYALLTGDPPFLGPGLDDYREQHLRQPQPSLPKETSPRLRALLSMMLRKESLVRPGLNRVLQQLSLLEQGESAQEGANKLGRAAAIVAEERSKVEAEEQNARSEAKHRKRTAHAAIAVLCRFSDELFERVESTAPEVYRSDRTGHNKARLGVGELTLKIWDHEFPKGVFAQSGWDVLAGGYITVSQSQNKYRRGASLWYTDRGQDYRPISLHRARGCAPSMP